MESDMFFLKQKLFRPNALRTFHKLLNNQSLSISELNEINWQKRKQLLTHAYNTVPYYREKFKNIGITPQDINRPDDWERVPILTRTDLVDSIDKIKSSHCTKENSFVSSTGGSTGNPVKVFHDRRYPYETLGWRMMSWWNLSPGANAAYVRLLDRTKKIDQLRNKIMWWPTKRIWLDAASISPAQMDSFIKSFNKIKPQLLLGYTGNIKHLALYIEKNSIPIHFPEAIWVTSCPISLVERSLFKSVFHAPLYDQYGCGEVYWLAAQCKEQGGLHINHDARYIEFLDKYEKVCKPGDLGKIIVTDIENYVFPLIRYENGDMGRQLIAPCPCGVTLPLMDSVKGRLDDLIRLRDGVVLSGFTTIFDDFPEAVRQFQIVQNRDYSINIYIVPNYNYENYNDICTNEKRRLDGAIKGKVPVNINFVDEIKSDRGKLRFIISDV